MLSKSQAKAFFIFGTAAFSLHSPFSNSPPILIIPIFISMMISTRRKIATGTSILRIKMNEIVL